MTSRQGDHGDRKHHGGAVRERKQWIRGVNLGGWLVMERYIVPYQFAITDCHLAGDFCWYPGALSAPPDGGGNNKNATTTAAAPPLCDLNVCHPAREKTLGDAFDYPIDEWTLAAAFKNKTVGEAWFNYHFENFISKQDLIEAKEAGVTHLRVPLPHWILGNVMDNEPWIVGNRWKMFKELCQWARELDLEVWPNLHTAPGSQNGFDNSGVENTVYTCGGWASHPTNVQRTLDILQELTFRMAEEGLLDVVRGFGLLNEPFGDCNDFIYQKFLNDALTISRNNLGEKVNIFVSDKFWAPIFNNGKWWLDPKRYNNTYLDTHFYHVFSPAVRAFDPNQHMQLVCQPDDPQLSIESCCYQDVPTNSTPSEGVRRISTEWSVAYDCHPGELLSVVMEGIAVNGIAPDFHREIEPDRKTFLKQFGQAQMVAYEAADTAGLSDGWFYWTLKMEGGAFAEWDFLRGIREGWLPELVEPSTASQDVYGTCQELQSKTKNNTKIVHPFPWIDEPYWRDSVPYQSPKHYPPRTWNKSAVPGDGESQQNASQQNALPTVHELPLFHGIHEFLAFIGFITLVYLLVKMVAKLVCPRRYERAYPGVAHESSPLLVKA